MTWSAAPRNSQVSGCSAPESTHRQPVAGSSCEPAGTTASTTPSTGQLADGRYLSGSWLPASTGWGTWTLTIWWDSPIVFGLVLVSGDNEASRRNPPSDVLSAPRTELSAWGARTGDQGTVGSSETGG